MKNNELFRRDPKSANLINDGQARILDHLHAGAAPARIAAR